jgi:hypothetical protein
MINKKLKIPKNYLFVNNIKSFDIIDKYLDNSNFFFNLMFNLNDFYETTILN